MTDDLDLPLFSGVVAVELPAVKRRRSRDLNLLAELVPVNVVAEPTREGTATLLPFPPSRNVRLISELAQAFVALRERHGRQCRVMLLDKRFRPIAAELRRMGVPKPDIEAELARLEKAVALKVWIRDGRPSLGSGGGNAA